MPSSIPLDVDILEHSFDLLAPRGDAVVDMFYRRLFAAAPDTRALFAADLAAQKRALLATLVVLRTSLRQLEAIVPALRALGARHRGYGVRPEQYPVVGTALLGAMAEVGGRTGTPPTRRPGPRRTGSCRISCWPARCRQGSRQGSARTGTRGTDIPGRPRSVTEGPCPVRATRDGRVGR